MKLVVIPWLFRTVKKLVKRWGRSVGVLPLAAFAGAAGVVGAAVLLSSGGAPGFAPDFYQVRWVQAVVAAAAVPTLLLLCVRPARWLFRRASNDPAGASAAALGVSGLVVVALVVSGAPAGVFVGVLVAGASALTLVLAAAQVPAAWNLNKPILVSAFSTGVVGWLVPFGVPSVVVVGAVLVPIVVGLEFCVFGFRALRNWAL